MDVGIALPTMAAGYSRSTTLEWCAALDESPFSSVSCGERLTFRNPEMFVTLAAAAALTERVRIFANLVVLPWHAPAVVAKQFATLDVLSGGRLVVGVGVGGREEDFRAAGAAFEGRHRRLDDGVAELRRLWAGEPHHEGSGVVGPAPAQGDDVTILAGAVGPKALARAARWADGVTGFSIGGDPAEMAPHVAAARAAWAAAGREEAPRVVSGCFFCLGPDAEARLRQFTYDYLEIFGRGFARRTAEAMATHTPGALAATLAGAAEAGVDELVLVPATTDPACLAAAAVLCRDEIA